MAPLSMARIRALCLALVLTGFAQAARASDAAAAPEPSIPPYFAWHSETPHAPPSPLLLTAAPPPELPGPELARRPFELSPELSLGFAQCADGDTDGARCNGLSAGLGGGGNALWRVSPYFALGGTFSALSFGFHPSTSSGLHHASARGLFFGLLGRVYFLDHGPVEPYLELGLGGGSATTSAREWNDVQYDETATGSALRLGGAIEFYLSRHVRLGPAFTWTRLDVARLHRCANSECIQLEEASYAHGTGFSSASARLTILLGPGL
ncbi:MAG: hypothetical protein ABI488_03725 [Polyangiaceae bacterium]